MLNSIGLLFVGVFVLYLYSASSKAADAGGIAPQVDKRSSDRRRSYSDNRRNGARKLKDKPKPKTPSKRPSGKDPYLYYQLY